MNRKFQVGPVFRNIYQSLIPQLEARHGFHVMKVDEAEADDLVAVLTRTIQEINPMRWVFILTNDHDYLQLTGPRVEIWSLQNRLLNRCLRKGPDEELELKIWSGDTSDTIPSCWENIPWDFIIKLCDPEQRDSQLEVIFRRYPHIQASYERNRKLIDFKEIPIELQTKILHQATPFFMGTTANAIGWTWDTPPQPSRRQPDYIPQLIIPIGSVGPRRPIISRQGNRGYHSRVHTQRPQAISSTTTVNGILNRSGTITWVQPQDNHSHTDS
jgi:hypothetical protein